MYETHRMLGQLREAELLAEADRLHAGRRAKAARPERPRGAALIAALALIGRACGRAWGFRGTGPSAPTQS